MNRNILHIDASARRADSDSRRLTGRFLARWREALPGDRVTVRDIVDTPLPHLDETLVAGLQAPADQHTPQQAEAAVRADELTTEFLAADVLVLGVPMYNFGIPSTLKAWIDHIAIPGRTFSYTAEGTQGLAGGKTVYVLSTRGGVHGDGPMDHQVSYLKTVFGFLGIDDVRVIQAEGLDMGDPREPALGAAQAAIEDTFAAVPVAV